MHPVDRAATRIWFQVFPLALADAMARPDAADLARRMALAGRWRLADQIDTSHHFLFGHRFWPLRQGGPCSTTPMHRPRPAVSTSARRCTRRRHGPRRRRARPRIWSLGITAVGLRTLQQVGAAAMAAGPLTAEARGLLDGLTADAVLARRRRPAGQGVLNVLRGARKQWTVTFDEQRAGAPLSAGPLAARDHRRGARRTGLPEPRPALLRGPDSGAVPLVFVWHVLGGAAVRSGQPVADGPGANAQKLLDCGVAADGTHPVDAAGVSWRRPSGRCRL